MCGDTEGEGGQGRLELRARRLCAGNEWHWAAAVPFARIGLEWKKHQREDVCQAMRGNCKLFSPLFAGLTTPAAGCSDQAATAWAEQPFLFALGVSAALCLLATLTLASGPGLLALPGAAGAALAHARARLAEGSHVARVLLLLTCALLLALLLATPC